MTDFWPALSVEAARKAASELAMTERWSPVAAVRLILSAATAALPEHTKRILEATAGGETVVLASAFDTINTALYTAEQDCAELRGRLAELERFAALAALSDLERLGAFAERTP